MILFMNQDVKILLLLKKCYFDNGVCKEIYKSCDLYNTKTSNKKVNNTLGDLSNKISKRQNVIKKDTI